MAELQRNAFYSKLTALITAYESNANATQSIAGFLVARAGMADDVIKLATGLQEALRDPDTQCSRIARKDLSFPGAQDAFDKLGFTDGHLQTLCPLIIRPSTTSPPASPPRGKESGKKE